MPKNFPIGLALVALAAAGCHVRAVPDISTPPDYSISHESGDGVFGKKIDATLSDEGNHYMQGFRFELPAPGGISATAKPVNPQAQVSVAIYAQGSGSDPIAKGEPGKKVEA